MKPILNSIFTNDAIKQKVHDTHAVIKTTFKGLTLEQSLVVGPMWSREKIDRLMDDGTLNKLIEFFYEWDYDNGSKALKDFGVYNSNEIVAYAKWRAKYMQRMVLVGYDLSHERSIEGLEEVALHGGEYASVSFAIKCHILGNFKPSEYKEYKGLLPCTSPVRKAVKALFGEDESQYRHTLRCNQIGSEIGRSSMFINTVLWNLGYN